MELKDRLKELRANANLTQEDLAVFVAINGVSNGAPYLLWTWVFSSYGIKVLDSRNLLIDLQDPTKEILTGPPKILFCRKCGANLEEDSRFCRKCGTEIKEEEQ